MQTVTGVVMTIVVASSVTLSAQWLKWNAP